MENRKDALMQLLVKWLIVFLNRLLGKEGGVKMEQSSLMFTAVFLFLVNLLEQLYNLYFVETEPLKLIH